MIAESDSMSSSDDEKPPNRPVDTRGAPLVELDDL